MDFNWFQHGPIPSNAMSGHYNFWLVGLSYVIAVLASYVAVDFVGRLRAEESQHAKTYWLVGGALSMGAGIWSMHFIGMLAFVMPMQMGYDLAWTIGSLAVAIFASALALFILRNKEYSVLHLVLGGIIFGLAIATMHYMGMQGMKTYMNIRYLPSYFMLSIAIAIFAAEAALWFALQSNQGSSERQFNLKIVSALIMGFAICGMHYMGMTAAVFTPNLSYEYHPNFEIIKPDYLAIFIGGISALIIMLALTVSTYYKQMVQAVQNEKEFLNAMLNNLEDGIIACDANGKITVFNQAIQRNSGLPAIPKTINNLLEYFNLYEENKIPITNKTMPITRSLKGERIHELGLLMRFKNNVSKEVLVNGQQIIDREGNNLGAVMVIHDVTELKKTERLKSEFVSIVSHELRTPLTSIRGSLGLLASGSMGEFPAKAHKLIMIANNNCERLLSLINDILDIEKIEAGKMDFELKHVDLSSLVNDAVDANRMYAEKFSVTIRVIQQAENIQVIVDPNRLIQVLSNLISNACKFSPKGSEILLVITQEKEMVRISVVDQGPGIPVAFQKQIFQKFSQADSSNVGGKGGTGLGLNISKAIIEKMNGKLGFTTKQNEGTTFYFDLPIYLDNSPAVKHAAQLKQKRLLICEDDQDQADYLAVMLEAAGFVADRAYTVAQAKKLLSKNNYQALLLDLILPDQDGISLIRELRANKATENLPIIVLSVIAQTGQSLLNGDAVSVVDWLEKPVKFDKFLESINRIKTKTSAKLPHILHVEDDVDTQHVIAMILDGHADITTASTLQVAKELIGKEKFDLVILDLTLPDGNSVEILPLLAKYNYPILVFSAAELDHDYSAFVSQALVKSKSSNEDLLKTIINLL